MLLLCMKDDDVWDDVRDDDVYDDVCDVMMNELEKKGENLLYFCDNLI